jgi:hypothetical protein
MKPSTQVVGNSGLYYACYQLSQRGWNVMPTARNAKGIDIIAYDADATSFRALQVKALTRKAPVPLGQSLDKVMGDFWIIVNNLGTSPQAFILTPDEVIARAHRGEKEGRVSFWLQPRDYALEEFCDRWDRIDFEELA